MRPPRMPSAGLKTPLTSSLHSRALQGWLFLGLFGRAQVLTATV